MKKLILSLVKPPITQMFRNTLLCLLLTAASAAYGDVPALKVIVSDAGGNVAFKGVTKADATFATGKLQPGNYVVQFNSTNAALKGNQYLLVISAGSKKVIADAVAGEKFTGGGVAMKVEVGSGLKITGQVAREQNVSSDPNQKVKVINGKRYVWVNAETGSNLAAHWEAEGVAGKWKISTISFDSMRWIQDRTHEGSMLDVGEYSLKGY